MSRRSDPDRKPALLAEIIDHLLDKPLGSLTFRTLASALKVSTYTLVYHFGSRAELIREIVAAISERESELSRRLTGTGDLDAYYQNLRDSWQWMLQPRNRQLQRLEFEAGMLELVDPDSENRAGEQHARWVAIGVEALTRWGLEQEDAELQARFIVDCFFGLQYDLLVTGDAEGATATFERLLAGHRDRIEEQLRQSQG